MCVCVFVCNGSCMYMGQSLFLKLVKSSHVCVCVCVCVCLCVCVYVCVFMCV